LRPCLCPKNYAQETILSAIWIRKKAIHLISFAFPPLIDVRGWLPIFFWADPIKNPAYELPKRTIDKGMRRRL
ncbi:MAG: hypothetical protein WA426_16420, partial [Silvibacterium sp.]